MKAFLKDLSSEAVYICGMPHLLPFGIPQAGVHILVQIHVYPASLSDTTETEFG